MISELSSCDEPSLPDWMVRAEVAAEAASTGALGEGKFFLLLDGAQVPNLPDTIAIRDLKAACLFKGEAANEFADVAPWLVHVRPEDQLFRALFSKTGTFWDSWGRSRFVLLKTNRCIADLQEHFRGFLRYVGGEPSLIDEFGRGRARGMLFRFYDAQILADWLIGTAEKPERAAGLLGVDGLGARLIDRVWLAEDPTRKLFLEVDCSDFVTSTPGPRAFDDLDRAALRAGADRRLIARTLARVEPEFEKIDSTRLDKARNYVRACLDWLRYWPASPREANDLVQLSLLVYMLGDARDTVISGPVMSERLIPVSERIALTRDSLLSEMRRIAKERV